ncbi:phosphoglycerate kinase [Candidatus Saccharibacteria bacterium]|nr:phosphoglycerate kinase [Candidatus Saccharibacteria bacterium]
MVGFNKKTVHDADLKGKRVLLRADYNVPIKDGKISDDYRITQSLPTINYIWEQYQSSLVIISHLGRPEGKPNKDFSLAPVAKHLSKLLCKDVKFVDDCVGEAAKAACDKLGPGEILLLENLRFHAEEEKNDKDFAKQLVETSGAEVFVQDGFGVVHRAHASTEAVNHLLPSVAGLLLAKEVETIDKVIRDPAKPLVSVVGGAKISDKIEVLNKLIEISDCVAIVGAMANNFLLADKFKVGKSMVERELLDTTREILQQAKREEKKRNFNLLVPIDVVVSKKIDGTAPTKVVDISVHNMADIQAYPKTPKPNAYSVGSEDIILDIGPQSAATIAGAIKLSSTVIWNGTCGVTETKGIAGAHDPFAHATHTIMEAMIGDSNAHKNKPFSFVGGGDTVSYVEQQGLTSDFSHVSTGGGASLELISGHKLPGVEALEDKN